MQITSVEDVTRVNRFRWFEHVQSMQRFLVVEVDQGGDL